ncbi:MAG: pyridoxal phosphate-dependent aminotransferase [Acidobacteria bacterium]|nr:pyridoxal phosphate-dependent aminotransferase [Acidobacteriota bacterium]
MRFTKRISSISESATMAVAAKAAKLQSEGVDVVAFGAGEPDFATPDNIKQAAIRALDENFTKYTAAGGIPQLKKAICDWHATNFGTDYAPNECIACVGAKHVIFNTMAALIEDGDEVILPAPYWVTFYDVVNYHGGKPIIVQTSEDEGFRLSANDIEKALTDRTKLVIVNSPSNPSGAVVSAEEFEKIYNLVAARGAMLLADECYSHFVYDGDPFSIASVKGSKPNLVVAGSLSKTFAMTGWRLGYALAPAALISAINNLQSHSTSNPTSIVQKAAIEALTGPQDSIPQMLAEYRKRRDYVIPTLRSMPGVRCAEPGGAFYAYPNISAFLGKNGMATPLDFSAALLDEAHVAVVPSEAFGTNEHVRISYATSMHEIERGLERIRKFLADKI